MDYSPRPEPEPTPTPPELTPDAVPPTLAKPPVPPPVKPRSRFWKWLKRIVIAVLSLVAVFFVYLVIDREVARHQGNRELDETIAKLDAADPGWRWVPLNAARKRPPAGHNSAELIPKIAALTPKNFGRNLNSEEWKAKIASPANMRLPEDVIAELRNEMNAAKLAVELARSLMDFPEGYRDVDLTPTIITTKLPHLSPTREVANLLRWDVVLALENHNTNNAVADLHAMLNVSRSIGDEPTSISQLIRMATRRVATHSLERVLGQLTPSESQLASLQASWAADVDEPLLLYAVRCERASFDLLFTGLRTGTIDIEELDEQRRSLETAYRLGWWFYRSRLPQNHAYFLRWMTQAVDIARQPPHEQLAAMKLLPIPGPQDKNSLIARLLLPAVDKLAASHLRSMAEARCAIVGIACERFRLERGRWPDSLAELSPAYLTSVLLDPFDGQPLRYVKQDDGVIVHSTGTVSNVGVDTIRPGLPDGIAIGFRLWNPESRRQPAPPAPKDDDQP
jgi:hypothetical protein